ncbi:MAG: hypothetical protein GY870_08255 [archaeon]|nr:hypothetical protein [archaeon]
MPINITIEFVNHIDVSKQGKCEGCFFDGENLGYCHSHFSHICQDGRFGIWIEKIKKSGE